MYTIHIYLLSSQLKAGIFPQAMNDMFDCPTS